MEGEKSERKAHSVSLARQMWRVRPFLLNCRARPPPAAPPLLPLAPTTSSAPPPPTVPAISSTLSSLAVVFVYAAIPTTPQRYSPLRSPVFVLHLPSFLGLSFHVPVACPGRMRARAHTSTNSFEQKDRKREGGRRLTSDRGSDTVHPRRKTPPSRWKRDHCRDGCGFVIAMRFCSCAPDFGGRASVLLELELEFTIFVITIS